MALVDRIFMGVLVLQDRVILTHPVLHAQTMRAMVMAMSDVRDQIQLAAPFVLRMSLLDLCGDRWQRGERDWLKLQDFCFICLSLYLKICTTDRSFWASLMYLEFEIDCIMWEMRLTYALSMYLLRHDLYLHISGLWTWENVYWVLCVTYMCFIYFHKDYAC